MANEYEGNLIADLYATENDEQAVKVLREMDETSNTVFVSAIIAAFKKYRKSYKSHWFLLSLSNYKSSHAIDFLNRIAQDPTSSDTEFIFSLSSLTLEKIKNASAVERCKKILSEPLEISAWELERVASYLIAVDELTNIDHHLYEIVNNNSVEKDIRKNALLVLMQMNSSKCLQYFLDNKEEIRLNRTDIVISEILKNWNGTLVEKIEDYILSEGSDRAKEIISAKRSSKKRSDAVAIAKKAESNVDMFSNGDIVIEIVDLKKSINLRAMGNVEIGFPLLPDSDRLVSAMKTARNSSDIVELAISLRSLIVTYPEKISQHGFTYEQALEIIPGMEERELTTPLFRLHLFLHSRSVVIPGDFFGFRKLNVFPNKVAHPEDDAGFVVALKKNYIYDLYAAEDWKGVQRKLLENYRDALIKLRDALPIRSAPGEVQ